MKIFFWTMVAVVAGIFVYSRFASKVMPFSRKNPDPKTVYKDTDGRLQFAGPDIDPLTGAYNNVTDRLGTVEFPAQNN